MNKEYYLKVKDDIDLKELEKFGFEDLNPIYKNKKDKLCKITNHTDYFVDRETRIIETLSDSVVGLIDSTLYDLQVAGIIEKTELIKIKE